MGNKGAARADSDLWEKRRCEMNVTAGQRQGCCPTVPEPDEGNSVNVNMNQGHSCHLRKNVCNRSLLLPKIIL